MLEHIIIAVDRLATNSGMVRYMHVSGLTKSFAGFTKNQIKMLIAVKMAKLEIYHWETLGKSRKPNNERDNL